MDLYVKNRRLCITNLNDDALHLIFEKLDQKDDRNSFGLTCHQFLYIQNVARKRLEVGVLPLLSCSIVVDNLLNRFRQLESLSLTCCYKLSDSGLKNLHVHGTRLRSLNLSCCGDVTDAGLAFVASGCRSLSIISLYKCSISDYGLELLTIFCNGLKQVDIAWCSKITDFGIRHLNQNCRQLRALRISGCQKITGVTFQGFSPTFACLEAENCGIKCTGFDGILSGGGLEYLNLSSPVKFSFGGKLTALNLGFASNLKTLDFKLNKFVTNNVVIKIAKSCPLLQEWNLSSCHNIGLSGWEAIGLYCQNLERLHVNGCTNLCNRGLLALGNGCKRLSVIYMTDCFSINPSGICSFKILRQDVSIKRDKVKRITPSWAFKT